MPLYFNLLWGEHIQETALTNQNLVTQEFPMHSAAIDILISKNFPKHCDLIDHHSVAINSFPSPHDFSLTPHC
jgi:hypothetical protein